MGEMKIEVTSYPDEDNLVAELWWRSKQWGEIIFDDDSASFLLTIYSPAQNQGCQFPLADALTALERAKDRLTQMGYGVSV